MPVLGSHDRRAGGIRSEEYRLPGVAQWLSARISKPGAIPKKGPSVR